MVKRIISALLLCSMLLSAAALTGCSGSATKDPAQTNSGTSNGEASESVSDTEAETTSLKPELPEKDFEGYELNILTRKEAVGDPWGDYEMAVEELNGEVLNDSIAQRNSLVEETYNVVIKQTIDASVSGTAKKTVMAGDDTYDMYIASLFDTTEIAKNNLALDLNTLGNIKLSNPWWDQSSVRDLSIGNHQYFATGDFSFRNYNASWIYAFNKQMIKDFALDDPYELVNSGKWTIDKFSEMMTGIAADVDGNGEMNELDRYGLITEESNTLGMFFGAENFVISKDADNYPKITIYSDRAVSTLEKLFKFINDSNVTVSASDKFISSQGDVWKGLVDIFSDDRGLFYSIVMYTVKKLRNMETDFGLLPMPKYDEAQELYYTWTSPWISSGLVIPTTSDPERTSIIAEYMCYVSSSTIRPAYYDATLNGKYTRDDQSSAMIDIILGNRVYDLGMIYDWGGVGRLINSMTVAKKNDFSSQYQKLADKAQTALDKSIEEFKALG